MAAAASGPAAATGVQPTVTPTTQLSEFAQRQLGEDVIDFAAGQPSARLLPLDLVAAGAAHRFAGPSADPFLLQYGPEQGYASFRRALAAFLLQETSQAVDPDQLLITAGVSHGLDLCCRLLAAPGDAVLVESPTYFLAGAILRQAGLQPVAVPMAAGCIDVAGLEQLLSAPGAPRPTLLYTIPVHNNPTGVTLPLDERRKLLQLAHKFQFTVIADEVYQLLSFPASPDPPPPLRATERDMLQQGLLLPPAHGAGASSTSGGRAGDGEQQDSSRVVSLGSMSKILAPGMRLGWIEASPSTLARLRKDGVLGSGGSIAPLASGIAHSCIELGLLQKHLHGSVRPQLQAGCEALCAALRQHLPACKFNEPLGGYFVWLELPAQVCAQELLQLSGPRHKVRFCPGAVCDGQAHMLRLSFSFYSPAELQEGVRRLAAALADYLASG